MNHPALAGANFGDRDDGGDKANFSLLGGCAAQDALIEFSAPLVWPGQFQIADFATQPCIELKSQHKTA